MSLSQTYIFLFLYNLLPMKTAVDLWSNIIAMELLSPHFKLKRVLTMMLEHRSTALGINFNSQELKHS